MATIRKRNNRWQVMVRRKDAPKISKTFHRKDAAEAWAREMEIDADRGVLRDNPQILRRITLGELLERYRTEISIDKAGVAIESIVLNAFNRHPLSKRSLASLKPADFASYRDQRLKEVSGSTINRQLCIIQHAFDIAAKEWGMPIRDNPLSLIRKPKNNPARERRLAEGEFESLLVAAAQCKNKLIRPVVILAVKTAMRRGELLNIQRDHVSLAKKYLHIPKTKTGAPRTIPLCDAACEIIQDRILTMPEVDDLLFPVSANALRLAWERIKKRAGVSDLHFHDLRHEAISRLFERGLGVAHVAAISGHKDFRMLARYTHLGPEHSRM